MNSYQGSAYQQAVSGVSNLNNTWYDGKTYQSYAMEYSPGKKGKVSWYIGTEKTWAMDTRTFGPNGNIGQRVMPEEPMAVVVNFGMSSGFAYLDTQDLESLMPATMRIDYVRIYQIQGQESVTCDPPGFETTDYISKHVKAYNNPNLTTW
jgi:beta-glucan synthesis-associated protein KRE6